MAIAGGDGARGGASESEISTILQRLEAAGFEAAAAAALAGDETLADGREDEVAAFDAAEARVREALERFEAVGGDAAVIRVAGRLASLLDEIGGRLRAGDAVAPADVKALGALVRSDLRPAAEALAESGDGAGDAEASSKEARAIIDSAVDEIDQISLNVRLISLNASVEAARAGEAGRGFGVIASEIQNLATRSQVAVESVRRQLASIG